ncbi:hypothetical protein R0J91_19605, partial [Micrococcus sp. SIMBA_131]
MQHTHPFQFFSLSFSQELKIIIEKNGGKNCSWLAKKTSSGGFLRSNELSSINVDGLTGHIGRIIRSKKNIGRSQF